MRQAETIDQFSEKPADISIGKMHQNNRLWENSGSMQWLTSGHPVRAAS